jgi:hypothetical protein
MNALITGKDAYVKAALVGLSLYFVGVLIIVVAVLLVEPSEIGFIAFFLVPALVIGAAVLLWKRWGLFVGVLGGLFGLLALTDGADLSLSTPAAFFDFSPTLLGIVGVVIVLGASLIGTIQYFRGQAAQDFSPSVATALKGLVGVLAAIVVVSGVLTGLSADKVSAADKEGAIIITASEVDWDVDQVTGRANQPLKLVVRNEDSILHTFTVSELDIDVKLTPWSEHVIEINAPAKIYGFICRVVGHEEDMTGAITIQ